LAHDLRDVVGVCRKHGVPLLVDEAHGSHLPFLPEGGPQPALDAGADVVVQSCHKTLGSLVGTALLHVGSHSQVDPARLRESLNLLQSTSPNYLMLASLDAVRRHMWRSGRELFAAAARDADWLSAELRRLPGITVLQTEGNAKLVGFRRDPLRLVVNVAQTGWTGYEVEQFLREEYSVEDEFADFFNVVLVVSPNDDPLARRRLLEGFRAVSCAPREGQDAREPLRADLLQPPIPPLLLSPREAVLGSARQAPVADAVGLPVAETVTFYPPGIPLLMPGEEITGATLAVCQQLLAAGAHCYANDTTLATIKIVDMPNV
jgi:lysine decarboxylase